MLTPLLSDTKVLQNFTIVEKQCSVEPEKKRESRSTVKTSLLSYVRDKQNLSLPASVSLFGTLMNNVFYGLGNATCLEWHHPAVVVNGFFFFVS